MLKRLYVDNYKSLVNFECVLLQMQLILGPNGSGKTSLFEVLGAIRSFLDSSGPTATDAFPTSYLTRWEDRPTQTFEVDVEHESSRYLYRLEIEHNRDKRESRVLKETLLYDSQLLFSFEQGRVQLFNDEFKAGSEFHWNSARSALANVAPREDNRRLTWFKDWFNKVYWIQVDPSRMTERSEREDYRPDFRLSNFASWARHLWQEQPEKLNELYDSLKQVIEGFDSLPLVQYEGSVQLLKMRQKLGGIEKPIEFGFEELSDGQRALIALYTVLHFALEPSALICLDEPDNFLSLREIGPWLGDLGDRAYDEGAQVLFISHHPEFLNYLAPSSGLQVERLGEGPSRLTPFYVDPEMSLLPAEMVARGWNLGE